MENFDVVTLLLKFNFSFMLFHHYFHKQHKSSSPLTFVYRRIAQIKFVEEDMYCDQYIRE